MFLHTIWNKMVVTSLSEGDCKCQKKFQHVDDLKAHFNIQICQLLVKFPTY
jgi:hypothetical protein